MDAARILLVNPWITDFAAYDYWLKPLGLLYLAAVLRTQGYAVRLVDCMDRGHPELMQWQGLVRLQNRKWGTGKFVRIPIAKPPAYAHIPRQYARYGFPEEILKRVCIQGPVPDAILVTSGMTYWYPGVQQTVAVLRELFPRAPLLLGGIYATLCTEHAKEYSGADWVLGGEAEERIDKTVAAILSGKTVASRDDSSVQQETVDLDQLPFPAFDLYPNLHYAAIMTSRGCPLKCTFCASRLVSGAYRWRSIANVMAELEWLQLGLGLREFAFYDDALLTNRDRHFKPLCEQIIIKNLSATFHTPNGLQVKFIDSEAAQLMWRAGFKTIRLAFESGSEERQRDMSKKVSNESFAAGVGHLREAGFGPAELDAYVMMALPGQSLAEVLWSMAYVHSLGVGIRLAAFSPIPGTVDYARARARGDLPATADPLLSNNSVLPVRLRGVEPAIYGLIARLAKRLNDHLRCQGWPLDSCSDLYVSLQKLVSEASPRVILEKH